MGRFASMDIVNKIEELIEALMAYKLSESSEDAIAVNAIKRELEYMLTKTIYNSIN